MTALQSPGNHNCGVKVGRWVGRIEQEAAPTLTTHPHLEVGGRDGPWWMAGYQPTLGNLKV